MTLKGYRKEGNQDLIQKGEVKLQKGTKIFKKLELNEDDYRTVRLLDNKNTIKIVKKSDPRTDEEIREEWKESQERQLKKLSSGSRI